MVQQPQILLSLILIVFIAILPILAWRKSRSMCLPLAGLYGVFIYLYLDFISGKVTVYHDTYWNIAVSFSLIHQWILEGISLGWNPYLGGGQPLSIFSNYFLHAPVFLFTKIFFWLGWSFSYGEFFSLIWIFNHLWICTGVYLFLHLWFNSSFFGFWGASTMLLGGLFASDLAAPFFYVIGTLPYLLFSLMLFWKYGKWFGLYLFAAFLGIAVNYYNPLYVISFLLILLFFYLLLHAFEIKFIFCKLLRLVKAKPYGLALTVLLFLIPAAPFLHSYLEMGDYISPSRGFTIRGQTVSNTGAGISTGAPLESIMVLVDKNIQDMFSTTHTYFYIGILPYVTLFLTTPLLFISSKCRARAGVFILSGVVLALMAMGSLSPVPLWELLQKIPIFHMIRHTFGYAKMVTFLIIIIALEGLRALVYPGYFSSHSKIINKCLKITLLLLFGVSTIELILFSHDRVKILPRLSEISLAPFKYSSNWSLYGIKSSTNVFDLEPMVGKEAVWFHRNPSYVFMIHKDFIPFLRAATQEDLYDFGKRHPKEILLPKDINEKATLTDLYKELGFTKKITYAPLYATPETNYPVPHFHNIYGAINGKFNFYWEVDKKANKDPFTWLSIAFPEAVTVYGLRLIPHNPEELWRGDSAEFQISLNGKKWKTLMNLDLIKAGFDGSNRHMLFAFKEPVNSKYFRLFVNDRQFASLSKIELIDEPMSLVKDAQNPPLLISVKGDNSLGLVTTSAYNHIYSGNVLFDGNLDTFLRIYNPNDAFSYWISIKFSTPKIFNSILLIPANEFREVYYLPIELLISNDGEQWNLVKQLGIDGYNAGYYHLNQTVTAKYVRLQLKGVPSSGPPAKYSIAELRFVELPELKAEGIEGIGRIEPQPSADPNRVSLKIHAKQDVNLIRLENYNKGWNVYIDNKEVIMQKFGPNLQLIPMPAGDHDVRLEFHSWYDTLAWVHALFAACIWLLLAVYLLFAFSRSERPKM